VQLLQFALRMVVSILVLMDLARELNRCGHDGVYSYVSILVLMDLARELCAWGYSQK